MAGSLLALLVLRASPAGAWLSRPSSSGSHRGPTPSSLSLCDKYDAMLVSFVSTHRPDTAQLFCKITFFFSVRSLLTHREPADITWVS